jgi:hypothetical protein
VFNPETRGAEWYWHNYSIEDRSFAALDYPGYVTVELVSVSTLRRITRHEPRDYAFVESIRGTPITTPVIVDYDSRTGLMILAEGHHRLASRASRDTIPTQVMHARINPNDHKNAVQATKPGALIDHHSYCPTHLFPSEIGLGT